jgi:hypothetical protein
MSVFSNTLQHHPIIISLQTVKGEHVMATEKSRPFSEKYDYNIIPDPGIEKALRKRATGRGISCALAFEIADNLQVEPQEVGCTADVLDIPIVKCQLGLFGYKPDKKIVKPEDSPNQEVEDAVKGSSVSNRLTCEKAWQIAAQFNMSRLTICNICQANSIQIKACQLGAF